MAVENRARRWLDKLRDGRRARRQRALERQRYREQDHRARERAGDLGGDHIRDTPGGNV